MDNETQPLDAGQNTPGNDGNEGLVITENIRKQWRESANWGLFFAILGFLYIGFLVLAMLLSVNVGGRAAIAGIFGILVIGAIIFVPCWLILQYSQNLKKGLDRNNTPLASLGFKNLRRLYQFAGVLLIIVLALYGIMFLVGLLFISRTGL